jgi:hypothetical protein
LGLLLQIPEHRKASSTRHPERHPPPKSTTKPIITIAAAKAQGLKELLAAAESITRPLVQNTQKKPIIHINNTKKSRSPPQMSRN